MGRILTGLERLLDAGGRAGGLLPGARLGVLAHPASVDGNLRHAVERLSEAGFRIVRLFAPEHGIRGQAQDMEVVAESEDPETGYPVVSLYGREASTLRPSPTHLRDIDALICDLQDVGSRYYTFVYTLSLAMEACRELSLPVVVLDRPNPIGGVEVEGPVLQPELRSFVGRFPLPVRHGLTTGELAALFNEAFGIGCELRVVEMEGWRRTMHFEETGLPWVLPSPNMPTPDTARVYPGGCLVEGTNLSEGRGTTRPFELVGAPSISPSRLAGSLAAENLPGVAFRPLFFRPTAHKHAGTDCGGVQVHIMDRHRARPFATYLCLLREAWDQARGALDWRREPYEFESDRLAIDLLLGRADLRPAIETGATLREMEELWERDLRDFLLLRRRYLRYPQA